MTFGETSLNQELFELFNESIKLELRVSELYKLFSNALPLDASFWKRLAMEEENHANLLKAGRDRFGPLGKFPMEMLASSMDELISTSEAIEEIISRCKDIAPSRVDAFNIALKLEQSAGELHFLKFMEKDSGSELDKIFQRLNRGDKDHEIKIREYMNSHGIKMQ